MEKLRRAGGTRGGKEPKTVGVLEKLADKRKKKKIMGGAYGKGNVN